MEIYLHSCCCNSILPILFVFRFKWAGFCSIYFIIITNYLSFMENQKIKKSICFIGYPAPYFVNFLKRMKLNYNVIIINQLKSEHLIYSKNFKSYDVSFTSFKNLSQKSVKERSILPSPIDSFFDIISRDRYAQRIGNDIP